MLGSNFPHNFLRILFHLVFAFDFLLYCYFIPLLAGVLYFDLCLMVVFFFLDSLLIYFGFFFVLYLLFMKEQKSVEQN